MTPTLYSYITSLQNPAQYLRSLKDIKVKFNNDGIPILTRITRFANAEIEWRGETWLLGVPLCSSAISGVERFLARVKSLTSDVVPVCKILRRELAFADLNGNIQQCDLILQHLPKGQRLSEITIVDDVEPLLQALDRLQAYLQRERVAHNNLKPENLVFNGGRLLPIHLHNTCFDKTNDDSVFDALRRYVLEIPNRHIMCDTRYADYFDPVRLLSGHLEVGNVFEGLVCVRNQTGYGFVNMNNEVVIPAQFIYADDFHEGRAVVETAMGMGLIDKEGNYIIKPEYDIVEYDVDSGQSMVRLNDCWASLDYSGHKISEFEKNPIALENSKQSVRA